MNYQFCISKRFQLHLGVVKVGKSGLRIHLALDNFLSLLREQICDAGGKIGISVQIMASTLFFYYFPSRIFRIIWKIRISVEINDVFDIIARVL